MRIQRTLPPVAAPIPWKDILRSLWGVIRPQTALETIQEEFRTYFGVKHVWFVSSGKAALTLILLALRNLSKGHRVVVPGYTCFSVPSAVVRAECSVVPCDVEENSLDLDLAQLSNELDDETLCVLVTHLFGIGRDVARVADLCRRHGVFVVEDVAQALGGTYGGSRLGTIGDVAFVSFGRGKNVSCGAGGAILTNNDLIGKAIAREYDAIPQESVCEMLRNWLEVVLTKLLTHPAVYWLPASLPFLGLGETKFYTDFPVTRMGAFRAELLRGWNTRLLSSNNWRRARAKQALDILGREGVEPIKSSDSDGDVYLRLPVLMGSAEEKTSLCRLAQEEGLGISSMYPSSIDQIPELNRELSGYKLPCAASIAERLVTLPTHQLVTAGDVARICHTVGSIHHRSASPHSVSIALSDRQRDVPDFHHIK
ncbi:MAG: aminotransferase class V-fold PLP-dependent enzyme [Nitrospira sp.]|nr:MAG: aminotransferase class V-fold PLP-dependent enzyme [Nitrospira sp.]